LAACAPVIPRHHTDGETLIEIGDRVFKFFIVKSGQIQILDYSGDTPKTLAIHEKGEFTGDISHLTGMPAIFRAVARGNCDALETFLRRIGFCLRGWIWRRIRK